MILPQEIINKWSPWLVGHLQLAGDHAGRLGYMVIQNFAFGIDMLSFCLCGPTTLPNKRALFDPLFSPLSDKDARALNVVGRARVGVCDQMHECTLDLPLRRFQVLSCRRHVVLLC